MHQGKFISFEGGEGAGKTTQIALLADTLCGKGLEIVQTREPGGSLGAELIRELLVKGETDRWTSMTEALLMTASRTEHVARTIKPALERGAWVLCDRFFDSSVAYQGAGRGLGVDRIWDLQKLALGDFAPDLTILLDQSVEKGLARAASRESRQQSGEDRFERLDTEFHQTLRQAYLDIARTDDKRICVVAADQSIDGVHVDILAILLQKFGM